KNANIDEDFRARLRLASSRVVLRPLRMPGAVSGETSGNYKPHDHGLQPENLHQDHHSNSGLQRVPFRPPPVKNIRKFAGAIYANKRSPRDYSFSATDTGQVERHTISIIYGISTRCTIRVKTERVIHVGNKDEVDFTPVLQPYERNIHISDFTDFHCNYNTAQSSTFLEDEFSRRCKKSQVYSCDHLEITYVRTISKAIHPDQYVFKMALIPALKN
ncbi:hypothetical protein L9F63_000917, partial [Diploptera punctata]